MENQPETIGVYANDEIAVLRSGKAKKTDPPIPADLAPISGGKAPRRRFESVEKQISLDPIKFRYSTDTVAEAVEQAPEVSAEEPKDKPAKRNRNKGKTAKNDKPKQEEKAQPKQPKKEKPAPKEEPKKDASPKEEAPKEGAEQKKSGNHHHRRRYHHRKPKSGENKG